MIEEMVMDSLETTTAQYNRGSIFDLAYKNIIRIIRIYEDEKSNFLVSARVTRSKCN